MTLYSLTLYYEYIIGILLLIDAPYFTKYQQISNEMIFMIYGDKLNRYKKKRENVILYTLKSSKIDVNIFYQRQGETGFDVFCPFVYLCFSQTGTNSNIWMIPCFP